MRGAVLHPRDLSIRIGRARQSLFESFLPFRLRSSRTRSSIVASRPLSLASPWVFAGQRSEDRLSTIYHLWLVVRPKARLEDVRLHDLRHSYASRALALGESLTMIGKLLGHTQVQTTARYAHLARDSIQTAAARITGSIGGNL